MKGNFASFVVKECRHILRERVTLVMLFLIPLLLVMLFGYVISTDIDHTPIAVVDRSKGDPVARQLVQRLTSTDQFLLEEYLDNERQIEAAFHRGRVRLVVVIPERIGAALYRPEGGVVQLIADASDLNMATSLLHYAGSIVEAYGQELSGGAERSPLRTTLRMMYNPELKSAYMFVPGVVALIIMIVSAMMTSVTLTREKEQGTLKLLAVSPLRSRTIVLGKVVPYFVLSMINTSLVMILGMTVFGMPCLGSLWAVALLSALFIFAAVGLGVLISSLVRTQQTALVTSFLGLFLPTILLSGFIFPVANMPVVLQWASQAVPATWFIEGIKDLMLKGVSLSEVWMPLTILLGMALALIGSALLLFTHRMRPQ